MESETIVKKFLYFYVFWEFTEKFEGFKILEVQLFFCILEFFFYFRC